MTVSDPVVHCARQGFFIIFGRDKIYYMVEKNIQLSPNSLNLFLECPHCFWLDKNLGIKDHRHIHTH